METAFCRCTSPTPPLFSTMCRESMVTFARTASSIRASLIFCSSRFTEKPAETITMRLAPGRWAIRLTSASSRVICNGSVGVHPADANRVGLEFGNDLLQLRTVVREVHHQPAGTGKNRRAVGGLEAGNVVERRVAQRSDSAEIVQRNVIEEIGDKMRRRNRFRRVLGPAASLRSTEKASMRCGLPLSNTWNLSRPRSATVRPSRSRTTTGTRTSLVPA